jgi:2-C-methyl-D-erythritol 2,4-cyclodiphosphate synthase
LIIGGVRIDYRLGLAGHSDADGLVHAVADALLGAAGLGDIGQHFPDDDPAYKDISSLKILERTLTMIVDLGYRIVNLDTVVIAQKPKLNPYRDRIRTSLAGVLGLEKEAVSVKATTTEGLGLTGRGEGMAAQAVVLLDGSGA